MTGIQADFRLLRQGFSLEARFDAPAQGVTALFGASGSGKTTLLRCIAGLERASGTLNVNGETWQDERIFVATHRRALGYVFQESSLFPHLSVRDNLGYGYRRIPASARKVEYDQVVEWLGLARLIERKDPARLSGGERQRVAIGRALLTSPRILLLDEPLSALDSGSKQEIFPFLERLHRELNIPVLYVSHAMEEVARLADHLLLLDDGRIVSGGTLQQSLVRLDLPLAHLDDAGAIIEAQVAQHDEQYHLSRLDVPGGSLWAAMTGLPIGAPVRTRVLARDVSIATQAPQGSSISNILEARIEEIRDEAPDKVMLRLTVGTQQPLLSRITRRSRDKLGLATGMRVHALVKSVALMP